MKKILIICLCFLLFCPSVSFAESSFDEKVSNISFMNTEYENAFGELSDDVLSLYIEEINTQLCQLSEEEEFSELQIEKFLYENADNINPKLNANQYKAILEYTNFKTEIDYLIPSNSEIVENSSFNKASDQILALPESPLAFTRTVYGRDENRKIVATYRVKIKGIKDNRTGTSKITSATAQKISGVKSVCNIYKTTKSVRATVIGTGGYPIGEGYYVLSNNGSLS